MPYSYVLPSGVAYSFNDAQEAQDFLNSSLGQGAQSTQSLVDSNPGVAIGDIRGAYADAWNTGGGSVNPTYQAPAPTTTTAPVAFDPSGIYANQQVLQNDIGTVGQGVGQLAGFVGTPVNDGQTLFSTLGNQTQQLSDMNAGFVRGIEDVQSQMGDFRNLYEDNSTMMMGSLGTIEDQGKQALQSTNYANRQLQDLQPAVARTDAAVQGYQPGFMPPPALAAGAPQTNAALAQASQALAQMPNAQYGPQGPQFVDPRV